MTLDEATELAKRCDYGVEAVEVAPINWADAGAFFLEGYMHALRGGETDVQPSVPFTEGTARRLAAEQQTDRCGRF